MALIDKSEEIKRHNGSVTVQLTVESILSFIDDAINKHLVPAISSAQYESLLAWKALFAEFDEAEGYLTGNKVLFISSGGIVQFYSAASNTSAGESPESHPAKWTADNSKERAAFLLVQKAAVNFAIAYYVSFGSLQLSDSGAHVIQSGENRIASDKKLIQLKRQSMADGYFALEIAIEYLEADLITFASYAASSAHQNNRNGFINSSSEFNLVGTIQLDAQLYASLKNIQRQIEEDQVQAVLGEDLYESLKAAIVLNNLTADQQKLLTRVKKAVAPLTLAEAIPYKMITIDASGAFQLSDTVGGISGNVENKRPAEENVAQAVMNRLCSKGESELESLRKWLYTNYELFEDYTQSGNKSEQNPNSSGGGIYMI